MASSPWHTMHTTKNTTTFSGITNQMGSVVPDTSTSASSSTASGSERTMSQWGIGGRRANTSVNVNRYSARGTTQNRGPAAMSVVM